MKSFTVSRPLISDAMSGLIPFVEKRNTIPILGHALIEASDGEIVVTGTDLDTEISFTMPATIEEPFKATVGAHALGKILDKARPSDTMTLERWDGDVVVKIGDKGTFKLPCHEPSEFPEITPAELVATFTMPLAEFRDKVDDVRSGISTEETRYYLNGVFLHPLNGEFRFVTTDGHRFYLSSGDIPEGAAEMPGIIMPRRFLDNLLKLKRPKRSAEDISISIYWKKEMEDTEHERMQPSHIRLEWAEVVVTSKLIDGTFPDYPRVIPDPATITEIATFTGDDFKGAVETAMAIAESGRDCVVLNRDGDRYFASYTAPDSGISSADFQSDIKQTKGDSFRVGFNHKLVLGFIADMAPKKSKLTFEFVDAESPAIVRSERPTYWGVIMPMRV